MIRSNSQKEGLVWVPGDNTPSWQGNMAAGGRHGRLRPENSHLQTQTRNRGQAGSKHSFLLSKLASGNLLIFTRLLSKMPQRAPLTGDQAFKQLSLWGSFLIEITQPSKHYIRPSYYHSADLPFTWVPCPFERQVPPTHRHTCSPRQTHLLPSLYPTLSFSICVLKR